MQYHEAQVVHLFAVLTWGRPPVDFIRKKKKACMHTYVSYRNKKIKKKGKRKEGQGTSKRERQKKKQGE